MKIRLCGLVLLLLSGACFFLLIRIAGVPAGSVALKLVLATGAVLAGLACLALLACGPRLFDQLPVPLRSRHPATGVVEPI